MVAQDLERKVKQLSFEILVQTCLILPKISRGLAPYTEIESSLDYKRRKGAWITFRLLFLNILASFINLDKFATVETTVYSNTNIVTKDSFAWVWLLLAV